MGRHLNHSASSCSPCKGRNGSWRKVSSLFHKFLDWWEPKEVVVIGGFVPDGHTNRAQKVVTAVQSWQLMLTLLGEDDGKVADEEAPGVCTRT